MARSPRARRARKAEKKKPPIPRKGEGRQQRCAEPYIAGRHNADPCKVPPGQHTGSAHVPGKGRLRTVLFVDSQNMYMSAREAFGWTGEAGRFGNFRPYGLGRIMVRDPRRRLTQVRIYTGVPTPNKNPVGNAATQRRIAMWVAEKPEIVQVFPRPLRYPPPQGREKGVDVELAVDLVRLAMDDEFDVAVLASTDSDLKPPLEFVAKRFPEKTLVTMAWKAEPGNERATAEPLDLSAGGVIRVKVPKRDFDRIADRRDFRRALKTPREIVGEERWRGIARRLVS
jgi:uncharacterized LabA/DUF88 family protein